MNELDKIKGLLQSSDPGNIYLGLQYIEYLSDSPEKRAIEKAIKSLMQARYDKTAPTLLALPSEQRLDLIAACIAVDLHHFEQHQRSLTSSTNRSIIEAVLPLYEQRDYPISILREKHLMGELDFLEEIPGAYYLSRRSQ